MAVVFYNESVGGSGKDGVDGKDATINGFNVLNIIDGENTTVEVDAEAKTLKINAIGGGSGGGSDELWLPSVTEGGDISFALSSSTTPPEVVNIKGKDGESGVKVYPFSGLVWWESSEMTNYNYEADIPVPDVTPESLTQIIFDVEHAVAVDRAVIMGTSRELDGAVRIYAMQEPDTDITGRCIVFGGV